MKLRIVLIMLLAGLYTASCAQDLKPSIDLPVYPGSETAMEINMTSEDILPMAKAMLPLLSGKLGSAIEKVDPEELAEVLKDIQQIQMVQLDINDPKTKSSDVVNFYAENLPAGEWTRVLWQSSGKYGTVGLYIQPGVEGIYGFRARSISNENKSTKRVEVAKISGKIDFAKLVQIATKMGIAKL